MIIIGIVGLAALAYLYLIMITTTADIMVTDTTATDNIAAAVTTRDTNLKITNTTATMNTTAADIMVTDTTATENIAAVVTTRDTGLKTRDTAAAYTANTMAHMEK